MQRLTIAVERDIEELEFKRCQKSHARHSSASDFSNDSDGMSGKQCSMRLPFFRTLFTSV